MVHERNAFPLITVAVLALAISTGCSVYRQTVPGYCVGNGYQASRSDKEPINFLKLRQEPPDALRLDSRDVLGIYIEGVLGNKDEPPPVHFPEEGEDIPPAIGFPVPVREDGSISLPLVEPIEVRGLTLPEAERRIRDTYINKKILKADRERIIVTLMRPRTYHVLVVREDETTDSGLLNKLGNNPKNLGLAMALGQTRRGLTTPVELKAYENDVLHALGETGGMPGSDARNEVIILRGAFGNMEERDHYMSCMNDPTYQDQLLNRPNVVKIPLRVGPEDPMIQLTERDVILNTGDIVFVRSRETEVFYTGGLLPSGQWPIPRDYDIDVLQAISLAGGNIGPSIGSSSDGGITSAARVGPLLPATRIIILRELCGEQVPIEVNLRRAMVDPSERVRIQPGDFIMLEYRPGELVANIFLSTLRFNYLFNN